MSPQRPLQKQRHHFADKGPYSQSCGFSSSHVWMWELDYKERQRIDAFELWCWRRLLSLGLQGDQTSQPRLWCWERLRAGGEGDDRGWDGWMAWSTPWTWVWANSRRLWRTGKLVCCSPWGCKELVMTERLKNNNIDVYKWITWLCSRNWSIIFQFLKIN